MQTIKEKPEIANVEKDIEFIAKDVLTLQPNGKICKFSKTLNMIAYRDFEKHSYKSYWLNRHKDKTLEQRMNIEKACNDKFLNGMLDREQMKTLVMNGKDTQKEKELTMASLGYKI